jgi:hypothetical protein
MHWHKWSRWTDVDLSKRRFNINGEIRAEYVVKGQERKCEKCDKVQIRELGDDF